MRTRRLDDRGGSAIEAALLMAAVALVMLPALFLLGRAVDAAFSKPCDSGKLPGSDACASRLGSGGAGGGGAGGSAAEGPGAGGGAGDAAAAAASATRGLESWLADQIPMPATGGPPTIACDALDSATPPAGSTTACEATFANGDPAQAYLVEWGADGNPRLINA